MSANIEKQTDAKEVSVWDKLVRISLKEAGVAIALILILAFFSATAPYFATPENFLKIFVQIAINTVLAAGMRW